MKLNFKIIFLSLLFIPSFAFAEDELRTAVEPGVEIIPGPTQAVIDTESPTTDIDTVTSQCNKSDTNEAQCAVCSCYMVLAEISTSTAGSRYPGGDQALVEDINLLTALNHVPQARANHRSMPGNSVCSAVWGKLQFSIGAHNDDFRRGRRIKPNGISLSTTDPYGKEMLNPDFIEACKKGYENSLNTENPGHLFYTDSEYIVRNGLPKFAQSHRCRVLGDPRDPSNPISFLGCPGLEADGSRGGTRESFRAMEN